MLASEGLNLVTTITAVKMDMFVTVTYVNHPVEVTMPVYQMKNVYVAYVELCVIMIMLVTTAIFVTIEYANWDVEMITHVPVVKPALTDNVKILVLN